MNEFERGISPEKSLDLGKYRRIPRSDFNFFEEEDGFSFETAMKRASSK